jgi:pre-mRNA-processing factor 19
MFCAISGEVPQEPVVSTKSGHVFEKRLIEKHIIETSVCPVTGQALAMVDLVPLQICNPIVKPRPPTATSIPSMISLFQNEWDALMLETYNLKQQLDTTRQELAHAMYRYDAACRVIAKLLQNQPAPNDRTEPNDTSV